MSKKSKALGLHEPLRHQDHPRPRTRREFVAQSFMTGAATVIAPTLAGMLAIRARRAQRWLRIFKARSPPVESPPAPA